MNFSTAYDLLSKNDTKDKTNATSFRRTHQHFERTDLQADIKEYLDYINDNCLIWFEHMPVAWKSLQALSKPKTSILRLLQLPEVRQYIGQEYADRLYALVELTWKDNFERIIQERNEPIIIHTTHHDSSINSDNDDNESSHQTERPTRNNQNIQAQYVQLKAEKVQMADTIVQLQAMNAQLVQQLETIKGQIEHLEQKNNKIKLHFAHYVKTKDDTPTCDVIVDMIQDL